MKKVYAALWLQAMRLAHGVMRIGYVLDAPYNDAAQTFCRCGLRTWRGR